MTSTVLSSERFDVYRTVTDKIVSAIEKGAGDYVLPWHRSSGPGIGRPTNAFTTMPYQGVNVVALWAVAGLTGYGSGFWASYLQWKNAGAQVRKGERGSTIVFFKKLGEDDDEKATKTDDPNPRRFVARASWVFNAEQVEGWDEPESYPASPLHALEGVDNFVRATGARMKHGGERAFYHPKDDEIVLPDRHRFIGSPTLTPSESYYATLLHELTHWTGAKHRLDREFGKRFGDRAYAAEELVADLGSAFLCADLGISSEPRPDHAAYLAQWLELLKEDSRAIFTAAKAANVAGDYLHGLVTKVTEAA